MLQFTFFLGVNFQKIKKMCLCKIFDKYDVWLSCPLSVFVMVGWLSVFVMVGAVIIIQH